MVFLSLRGRQVIEVVQSLDDYLKKARQACAEGNRVAGKQDQQYEEKKSQKVCPSGWRHG
jgi:hypothetical protein